MQRKTRQKYITHNLLISALKDQFYIILFKAIDLDIFLEIFFEILIIYFFITLDEHHI